MSVNRQYAPEALSTLRNAEARLFLQGVGLPEDHLLFAFAEPLDRHVAVEGVQRNLIRVGCGSDEVEFCVDGDSGEVVQLNLSDSSIWHVSESPAKFLECLKVFESRFPYGAEGGDPSEYEEMADRLKDALLKIDPTVFDEDPGFWYTIHMDVAIGDYSEE